ncbi:hypothetical protein ABB27_18095 [Stenotrophomonas terrae]|uniref:Uncharacterized protein n=1 Tax=Stenotrophomonas terrae TaxID=405446 RepID=A0A0R0C014_9GAMM|nr:hypothetical protein ABB27_18095 [Stenotrophomonas terrae]
MIDEDLLQPVGVHVASFEFQCGPSPILLIDEVLQGRGVGLAVSDPRQTRLQVLSDSMGGLSAS